MVHETGVHLRKVFIMKEVHVLALPILFLLGIGITTLLDGAVRAFRRREQVRLHWLPFVWSVIILLFQLQVLAFSGVCIWNRLRRSGLGFRIA